jgi:hypothetical protein
MLVLGGRARGGGAGSCRGGDDGYAGARVPGRTGGRCGRAPARGERGGPGGGVLEPRGQRGAGGAVGHRAAQRAPAPLDAVGVRGVARRVDQHQGLAHLLQEGAQAPGPGRGVDAQVVAPPDGDPDGDPAPPARARHRVAQLVAAGLGAAAGASAQSNHPARQSTRPKPYGLVLGPGVSTWRCPRRPLGHHPRVSVGRRATSASSCRYRSACGRRRREGRPAGESSARSTIW